MSCYRLVIMAALVISLARPGYAQHTPQDLLKAVVKIRAMVPEGARSAEFLGTEREGNGVVIDPEGLVLTIGYLILEAESIRIIGQDDQAVEAAYVAYDHITGLGLVRAKAPLDTAPMQLGESSGLSVRDPILVASHGGPDAVLGARVVARQEFAGYWEYLLEDAIFTSPPHPAFGGAALIDPGGKLVGIGSLLTQVKIPGLGSIHANMFVPIDGLKPVLGDLLATGRPPHPPRPWLGVHTEETHGRVFVIRVLAGGPAERAGLRAGDIILGVGKRPVSGLGDFYRQLWSLGPAGAEVPLRVLQGLEIKDIVVSSTDRQQFFRLSPKEGEKPL